MKDELQSLQLFKQNKIKLHGLKTVSWFQLQNDTTTVSSSQVEFTNTSLDRVNELCQRARWKVDDAWE